MKIDVNLGLNQEGLFRVPGNQNDVDELRNAINKGRSCISLSCRLCVGYRNNGNNEKRATLVKTAPVVIRQR